MPYVKTIDRNQMMICSLDLMVDRESDARLIDAFVNSLNLKEYGVKEVSVEGRPMYEPGGMYKLYIYGNQKGIKSSRKLAESCRTNIEVKWMIGGVEPDFRTISDFRKDNIGSIKKIFREFNKRISGKVEWGFTSVDGSKFLASNSKDNNFTKNKLDDRIKWLNSHTDEYLRILDEMDEIEDLNDEELLTKETIEARLKEARERLERYEGYRRLMEESGEKQLSLTDADARLMKSKNGFAVAYNPQTAVDSRTHLIRDFQMTNRVTDHGLLGTTMEGIKEETEGIVEVVADKGYNQREDMAGCLEKGIVPHVIMEEGKDSYELEVPYEESESDVKSVEPEEIRKSLRSGRIPEAYKDIITDMEVKEVMRAADDQEETDTVKSVYGSEEEMKARAGEGYFVRDPEANLVYCPAGEILREKSIKKNGNIRYANKTACRHCKYKDRCYKGKNAWKEIDFAKDKLEKPCTGWKMAESVSIEGSVRRKQKREKIRVVRFRFIPDRLKMVERLSISEHPFGTIKRAMGSTYFLLRGLKKVEGEFALMCLGYNFKRAKNLLGFDQMMEIMAGA